MEEELFRYAINNGSGVMFGLLFYRMANTTLKSLEKAINELKYTLIQQRQSGG